MESTNFEVNQPTEKLLNEGSENVLLQPNNSTLPNVETPENLSDHQKEPPFFQYLFFISLIIFVLVAGANIYNLVNLQKNNNSEIPKISTQSISSPTPSSPSASLSTVCELNEKKYQIGESFPASDGCNTCTCMENLTISCTYMACPTDKIEATKSISQPVTSITTTPTKSLKPTVDQIEQ